MFFFRNTQSSTLFFSSTLFLPVASKNQLEPEAQNSCRVDILSDRDNPTLIDEVFLGRPEDLDVRRELHPRRYGEIVVRLEPISVPQKRSGSGWTGELRVRNIPVVTPDPELVQLSSLDDTFPAHSQTVEEPNWVRVSIRSPEPTEDSYPLAGAFL